MARCIKLSQAATVLRLSDDAAAAFDCCGCNRCFVPANDKCGTVAMCVTLGDGKPLTDHVVRHKPSHRQAHAHARTHARTHERAHFLALMRARTCVGMCSCAGVRVSGTGAGDQSREHYMRTDVALRIGPTSGCGLGFTSARTRVQICTGTRHETACCTASHINRVSQVALGGLVPLQHIITQTRRTVCEWMCK